MEYDKIIDYLQKNKTEICDKLKDSKSELIIYATKGRIFIDTKSK